MTPQVSRPPSTARRAHTARPLFFWWPLVTGLIAAAVAAGAEGTTNTR